MLTSRFDASKIRIEFFGQKMNFDQKFLSLGIISAINITYLQTKFQIVDCPLNDWEINESLSQDFIICRMQKL